MGLENNCISVPFHWGTDVLVVTILTLVVLVGTVWFTLVIVSEWPDQALWLKYLLMVIVIGTIVIGSCYAPIRLKANGDKITIRLLLVLREVPLSEVIEVRQISKFDVSGSIRTFGSGGLFGYLGRFKNNKLGSYTMYATEWNNLVLVRTNNKKYVISCTKAQDFVEYINSQLRK
jgi:hypothetical protein